MKAFWTSILLFALLIGCIGANAVYMHRTTDTLCRLSQALIQTENREEILTELEQTWDKNRPIVSLTVGYREVDHFGEILTQLRWAYEAENEEEFSRFCLLLTDTIEELIRAEEFSAENLF